MKKGFSLFRCILALALGAAGVIAGIYYPPLLPVLAAAVGFMGAAWGGYYTLLSLSMACTGIGFIYFPSDAITAVSWIAQMLLIAVTISVGFARYASYRHMAIIIAVTCSISLYAQICLPSLLAGEAPSAGIVKQLRAYYEAFAEAGLLEDPSFYTETISTALFGCIIMLSELLGFICVAAAYALFKLAKCEIRPMAGFSKWRLPKSLTLGTAVIVIACVILNLMKYSAADQLNVAVFGLLLPLFGVQGCSMLAFFFLSRPRKLYAKILFFIFIGFLVLFMPYMVAVLGLMEQLFNIRKRTVLAEAHMRLIIEARNKQLENEIKQAEHEDEKERFGENSDADGHESSGESEAEADAPLKNPEDNETEPDNDEKHNS